MVSHLPKTHNVISISCYKDWILLQYIQLVQEFFQWYNTYIFLTEFLINKKVVVNGFPAKFFRHRIASAGFPKGQYNATLNKDCYQRFTFNKYSRD